MIAVAAFLAIFIGMAVGLLGGGGSILTTPLLVYGLDFEPKQAIAASLLVVAMTSAFGLIQHAKAGNVHWRTGATFGAAGMLGAFIGGQVGSHLPSALLLAAFAGMMGVTAIAMVRGRAKVAAQSHGGRPAVRIVIDGLIVGFVTGLVGAGGGFLVVPALVLLGGLPMQLAVGTSLLVVTMKSLAGFLGYAVQFDGGISFTGVAGIDWTAIGAVAVAAMFGAVAGSTLSRRVHPEKLRKGFGWFVLAMAFFILAQEIGADILDFAQASDLQTLETLAGVALISIAITAAVRWPAKTPIADFDATQADDREQVSR